MESLERVLGSEFLCIEMLVRESYTVEYICNWVNQRLIESSNLQQQS
jgi:hypothetical protein